MGIEARPGYAIERLAERRVDRRLSEGDEGMNGAPVLNGGGGGGSRT